VLCFQLSVCSCYWDVKMAMSEGLIWLSNKHSSDLVMQTIFHVWHLSRSTFRSTDVHSSDTSFVIEITVFTYCVSEICHFGSNYYDEFYKCSEQQPRSVRFRNAMNKSEKAYSCSYYYYCFVRAKQITTTTTTKKGGGREEIYFYFLFFF